MLLAANTAVPVVRCSVAGDSQARVFELQRVGEGQRARWQLALRSRETGASTVVLPLPDALPSVSDRQVVLEYRTLNGGRDVKWRVEAGGAASLDVYTNYELEVNIETDLDPRVELMNTGGAISNLSCALHPAP